MSDTIPTPRMDAIPRRGPFHHYVVDDVIEEGKKLERELAQCQKERDGEIQAVCELHIQLAQARREAADAKEAQLHTATARDDWEGEAFKWQGILVRISESLGLQATKPDGNIDYGALAMKAPEAVEGMRNERDAARREAMENMETCARLTSELGKSDDALIAARAQLARTNPLPAPTDALPGTRERHS